MVIKQKFNEKVEEIISKGGDVTNELSKKEFTNFCIRIPTRMLENIEKILEERVGITRTGWILEAIQEKLKRTDNDH